MTSPAPLAAPFPGRALAGRARRSVRAGLQHADPSRLFLSVRDVGTHWAYVCIYRRCNISTVRRIVAALPPSACVRLWCFDVGGERLPADMAARTIGAGAGTRFVLMNRLIATLPEHARADALVLFDDDVRFVIGDPGRLVATGLQQGLDLFQPAHSARSHASWGLVHRRRWTVARKTSLVEQGPLLVLSRAAQQLLLPLPEDLDMGWGSEVRWALSAQRNGLSLGVVDAVCMRHLVPGATSYDRVAQEALLARELRAAGLFCLDELMVELDRVSVVAALRARLRFALVGGDKDRSPVG